MLDKLSLLLKTATSSLKEWALDLRTFGERVLILIPYFWAIVFFLIPFLIVLKVSLSQSILDMPPYGPVMGWLDGNVLQLRFHLNSYLTLLNDPLYFLAFIESIKLAFLSTSLCLLIGYPMAYAISLMPPKKQTLFLLLIIIPFWTSFLLRIYAWMGILGESGVVNAILLNLGLIERPLEILNTNVAVLIGMVYCYLPFMILPLYSSLQKFDHSLLEAAADLGCPPTKAFLKITLPLSMHGILAGSLLVFVPCVGEFVIPELLGPDDRLMIGKLLWIEFFHNLDWPISSAIAIMLLLLLVVPIVLLQKRRERKVLEL